MPVSRRCGIRCYYRPGTRIARISDWDERTDTIAKMAPHWDGRPDLPPSWVQPPERH